MRRVASPFISIVAICATTLCTRSTFAGPQAGSAPPIRVESNLVVVPATVEDKNRIMTVLLREPRTSCEQANADAFKKLPPSEPYLPKDCGGYLIPGLTAKDFHVFEDGVEQKIQSVTIQPSPDVLVRDNLGDHKEWSFTQRGKWSTTELPDMWRHLGDGYFYAIAYTAPAAETGCHKVAVKVHRPHAAVFARDGYCRTGDPASDALNGSKFEEKVQHDLASSAETKISVSLQATIFFTNTGTARVDLSLEFPWNRLKHEWDDEGKFYATVGVLGVVNRTDGTVASRFSDLACCSSEGSYSIIGNRSNFIIGNTDPSAFDEAEPVFDPAILPARYETQLDLPAGEYDLQVVLSDGSKYGRVERPLTIEPYDGTQIGLSSIALCKRVRYASAAVPEDAAANLAPEYVPLSSKGLEFTPAGDATFGGQDPFLRTTKSTTR